MLLLPALALRVAQPLDVDQFASGVEVAQLGLPGD